MAILTGLFRVTQDAQVRQLPSGEPVANISLAYNYGTKKDERGYLPSQFIEVGLFGKRAESLAQYLIKGQKIVAVISGVHIETFQKQDGSPGHKLAGRLDDMEFAGNSQSDQGTAPAAAPRQQEQGGYRASAPRQAPAPRPAPAGGGGSSGFDDMDDDIPFASSHAGHDPLMTDRKAQRIKGAR